MKKGYLIEFKQPKRFDMPLRGLSTYIFVKTKKEIREAQRRGMWADTYEINTYKVTLEKI